LQPDTAGFAPALRVSPAGGSRWRMKRKPRREAQLIRAAGPAEYQHARALVEAAVANHVVGWAKTVALTCTDARFERFRENVTEALHSCLRAHIGAPYRTYKRAADVRKDFDALADAATTAAEKLYAVQAVLDRLPPMYHNPAFRLAHPPDTVTFELEGLAEAARQHADEWKSGGLGGRPPKMPAFAALAMGLAQAFQNAIGQPAKVTWSEYRKRYEGMFFGLVEAILPTASEIAEAVTGRPLPVSKTAMARGKFLQRLTRLKAEDKTSPH
jgi:hypothetical protein